ncbi:MAG: hypothetical protein LRY42_02735 [Candidatus Pacebacteria bacterium]|nr:hypothetical protein [Candidatus Paceibacterota bacterium]
MQRIKKICISFCVVAILFMIGVVTEPRFRSADIMNPDVVGFITTAPLPETLQDITKTYQRMVMKQT